MKENKVVKFVKENKVIIIAMGAVAVSTVLLALGIKKYKSSTPLTPKELEWLDSYLNLTGELSTGTDSYTGGLIADLPEVAGIGMSDVIIKCNNGMKIKPKSILIFGNKVID